MTNKDNGVIHPPPYKDNLCTTDDDTYFIFNEVPDADDILQSLVSRLQKKWADDYKKIEERYNIRNIQFKDKMESDIQKVTSIYQKKIDSNNELRDQELLNYNNVIEGRVTRLVDSEVIPSYTPYTPPAPSYTPYTPASSNTTNTSHHFDSFKSLYNYVFN
jgi:hypothetical protein